MRQLVKRDLLVRQTPACGMRPSQGSQEQFVLQMKKSSLFTDVDLDALVDQEDSKFNNSTDVAGTNSDIDVSKQSDLKASPENMVPSSSSKLLSVVEQIRSRSDNDYRYSSNYDTYSSMRYRPFQPRMTTKYSASNGSGSRLEFNPISSLLIYYKCPVILHRAVSLFLFILKSGAAFANIFAQRAKPKSRKAALRDTAQFK
uniref:Uncharacterized protein n=1 Tax=Romanomermis culicivorax TaxID=13658 RepID=A0A915JZX0_ROMCU